MGPSFNDFGSFSSGGSAAGGFGMNGGGGAGSVGGAANGAIVSGPGDIRLASSRGGRKKWLVVVIALILAVAAVVAIVLMVVGGNGKSESDGNKYFNRYANYVLYGKDSYESVKNIKYDSAYDYYFEMALNSENAGDVIKKAREYQDDFKATADQNNSEIENILKEQAEYLDFASQMLTKEEVTRELLLASYKIGGRDGTLNSYSGYYSVSDEDDSYASWFSDIYQDWLTAEMDVFDMYQNKQCLDDYLNDTCLLVAMTEDEKDNFESLSSLADSLYTRLSFMYDVAGAFVSNIFNMKGVLYSDVESVAMQNLSLEQVEAKND